MKYKFDVFLGEGRECDISPQELSGLTTSLASKQNKMVYVTDSVSTDVTLSIAGGTHYEFTQPLDGLTFSSVENSHDESEVVFTAGTAAPTIDIPNTSYIVGFPSFEAEKSYIINVRDNIIVAAEYALNV